jgi:hypothetical protein
LYYRISCGEPVPTSPGNALAPGHRRAFSF